MNVLIIGGGGREHALAWKVAQSPQVATVFVAPGNAGTAGEARVRNVDIDVMDFPALIDFAQHHQVGLTIVGPEAPLVDGIVEAFQAHDLNCFGPSQRAAQLEGSKAFSKDFLTRHQIPTAHYQTFVEIEPARAYLRGQTFPIVIKADGLAAGKGVVIAETCEQACATVQDMLSGQRFGDAGGKVVIEEYLVGEEASFIVMCDGRNILPLATSQDHKARDDGDQGPNTGGMGAYSPAPVICARAHAQVMAEIIRPTVDGMAQEGNPYCGFLYAGLMMTEQGPKVLEYNCRFGDPETQPIMMRLQSDLVVLCLATLTARLDQVQALWSKQFALGVVMAAGGYPADYVQGHTITGLAQADSDTVKVFHAGTVLQNDEVVTHGGRVLCVCALAETVQAAQQDAYAGVRTIYWPDAYYRTDIGYKAIQA